MSIDGGPAFPIVDTDSEGKVYTLRDGMTLRDYFAAKAMHALIVEPPWAEGATATLHIWSKEFKGDNSMDRYAFASYAMADSMLKERQKGGA